MGILSELNLHPHLRARVNQVHPPPPSSPRSSLPTQNPSDDNPDGFVLYLPTVCLRFEQNPSFALACRAANHLSVPLVVLAVVLDDASHANPANPADPHRSPPVSSQSSNTSSSVVMTSRRLAFTLQALSHACSKWSNHGAAVGIRIHARSSQSMHPMHSVDVTNNDDNSGKDRGKENKPRVVTAARTPDHLTLASRSMLVVTDEPFVSPYLTLVQKVEEACRRSNVECVRVDGSCTVPPVSVLKKRQTTNANNATTGDHGERRPRILFDGVPAKAYMWQNKTEHLREGHLTAAMEGHFDAPPLKFQMNDEDLFAPLPSSEDGTSKLNGERTFAQRLSHLFPARWKPSANGTSTTSFEPTLPSAPDVRPFTSHELAHIFQRGAVSCDTTSENNSEPNTQSNTPCHQFALHWPGADPTVPPCAHIIGTAEFGMNQWNTWVQNGGLTRYGRERNDARRVHGVSRMSAFLNLGIVSIFRLVWEVKRVQRQLNETKGGSNQKSNRSSGSSRWNNRNKTGADKFEEEIVKWREMSYAHAFSREDYDGVGCVPPWSVKCLYQRCSSSNGSRFTIEQLALGNTGDSKWDAMQQYLVKTGELHNNVRMTWGKTVVEWGGCSEQSIGPDIGSNQAGLVLQTLCFLNDRYALDGLSPPSYAGILWCFGWCDKPAGNGQIQWKPAHRYKMSSGEFKEAEKKLLSGTCSTLGTGNIQKSVLDMITKPTKPHTTLSFGGVVEASSECSQSSNTSSKEKNVGGSKRSASKTIDNFFQKKSCKQIIG